MMTCRPCPSVLARRAWPAALAALLVAGPVLPRLPAATNLWTNSAGGDFTNAANWAALPGLGDIARFTNAAGYAVGFSSSPTNAAAWFDAKDGSTLTLNAAGQTWSVTNDVRAGNTSGASNTVVLSGGTLLVNKRFNLGTQPNSYSKFILGGAGTPRLVVTNDDLYVAIGNSTAEMFVSNGTLLAKALKIAENAGAKGTMVLSGGDVVAAGATAFVATSGTGALVQTGGMLVISNAGMTIGRNLGASGLVLLSGGTNRFVTSSAVDFGLGGASAGDRGSGRLVVNGGYLDASNANVTTSIGRTGTGAMYVSNGTALLASTYVGNVGGSTGYLEVAGGRLQSFGSNFRVALNSGATGIIVVTGGELVATNTTSVSNPFAVGYAGYGRLESRGGVVRANNVAVGRASGGVGEWLVLGGTNYVVGGTTTYIGYQAGASGRLLVDGGLFDATGGAATYIGESTAGSVTVSNGTALFNTIYLGNGSGSTGYLEVAGGRLQASGIDFRMAANLGATGIVVVTGGELVATNTGSQNNPFAIGYAGFGHMETRGGVVRAKNVEVGRNSGSVGEWIISGGSNYVLSGFAFEIAGRANGATGLIAVAGGLLQSEMTLVIGASGALTNSSQLVVSGGVVSIPTVDVRPGNLSSADYRIHGGTNYLGVYKIINAGSGRASMLVDGGALWAGQLTLRSATNDKATALLTVSNGVAHTGLLSVGGDTGGSGFGFMDLVGGRVVVSNALAIGSINNSSTGTLVVAESGVLEVLGGITNGNGTGGSGSLRVRDGGTLRFGANNPAIALNAGGSLAVTNAVIEFANAGAVVLTNGSSIMAKPTYGGTNTLSLLDSTNAWLGSFVFSNNLSFSALRLAGSSSFWQSTNLLIGTGGSLGGSGRVQANMVTNAGTVAPGNSPGTLTFSSNLTLLDSSVLALEIMGTNWSAYDHLVVEGTLGKGGSIFVTNLGGALALGDTFDFWDAAAVGGAFLGTNAWVLPTLGEDLFWDTTLFEAEGVLSVVAIPEPSALIALGAGLAVLLLLRARPRNPARS